MLYEIDSQAINTSNSESEGSDEQLMAGVTAKDEAALASLYHRYRLLLRAVISRVLDNDSDVDDMLQEIFVEIWNQAQRYDAAKGRALGWIVTLARRRSIDRLRRKQAYYRAEERLRLETESTVERSHQSADEDAIATDRSKILNGILETLPNAQRDALQLTYYHGLSQREIAARMGIPLGTIKTRIELAMRKVRNGVMSLGGADEWSLKHA